MARFRVFQRERFIMGALERLGLMVIGVLAIIITLLLAIILLAWYGATELFLRMFQKI